MLRGKTGQGAAAVTQRELTNGPAYPHNAGDTSDGGNSTVGSVYSASINERANKSNPRNQGPTRADSLVATKSMPIATKAGRKVSRVGG